MDPAFPSRSADASSRWLELADHLEYRTNHPTVGVLLVRVLARVQSPSNQIAAVLTWSLSEGVYFVVL
jgi:hypothetical protein